MKILVITLVLLATLFSGLYARTVYFDNIAREHHKQKQIGTYCFDIHKTDLGSYSKNGSKYTRMTVSFYKDNTFRFNMNAPFISDSTGTWHSGVGSWEWSELLCTNSSDKINFSWIDNDEDNIYIENMSPKQGNAPILMLYFTRAE